MEKVKIIELNEKSKPCYLCPRHCGALREEGERGYCKAPAGPKLALAALHTGEEPCISGAMGSGTIFFSHCNLNCVFCQNHQISQQYFGTEITVEKLANTFLNLAKQGAHNINLVSPTPYIPAIAAAIEMARQKDLSIPVIYNTNAYENVESLAMLRGLVDIYLPDIKYWNDDLAVQYSRAPNYFTAASAAVMEMFSQVGPTLLGPDGIAKRGLILRHLVLPGHWADSVKIIKWIAGNLPSSVYVSLMSQYFPAHRACETTSINRRLWQAEYQKVISAMEQMGIENGYIQSREAASDIYVPIFDLSGFN